MPSILFRKAFDYSKKNYDIVEILSTKYGLLSLDRMIKPYDKTLNKMKAAEIKSWSEKVFNEIKSKFIIEEIRKIYFHAGIQYRKYLIPKLREIGVDCIVPLEGLRIGEQLAWYNKQDY